MPVNRLPPIHPGEFLREEFMVPLGLSANALARRLHVPPNRITAILQEKRSVTADTALRLGRFFGTTPQLWLNLQASYDLKVAEASAGPAIEAEVRPLERAA
jgi:antitoxin HigA-1